MHTQVWHKYLPVIKILLKKSIASEQTLGMNVSDFERAGFARKSGYKFHIEFMEGRAKNVTTASDLAKELSMTLLEDETVKELFNQNEYHISMNAKFQLLIKAIPVVSIPENV